MHMNVCIIIMYTYPWTLYVWSDYIIYPVINYTLTSLE